MGWHAVGFGACGGGRQGDRRATAMRARALLALLPLTHAVTVPPSGAGLVIRYFAYGSNLAEAVREGRRKLKPFSAEPGLVRDHRLAFNVPGFLSEPAFASIARSPGDECHGGVYELSASDWARLCMSEGVPFGYRVKEVEVELYYGEPVKAWTLEAPPSPLTLFGDLPPSERYLSLIRDGARELGLTRAWQERLAQVQASPFGSRPTSTITSEDYERRPGQTFV